MIVVFVDKISINMNHVKCYYITSAEGSMFDVTKYPNDRIRFKFEIKHSIDVVFKSEENALDTYNEINSNLKNGVQAIEINQSITWY